MGKIPTIPAEVFGEFTDDCQKIFGDPLHAIYLFGSGARGEYRPKHSDLNFLLLVGEEGLAKLRDMVPYIKRWKKRAIAIPLVMTPEYLLSSLDSYPMEFLDMKLHHVVVFGEDLLKDLVIKRPDLRLQLEREVKGKLIHLRQNFVASGLKPKVMRLILVNTIPTFRSIFTGLLYHAAETPPQRVNDLFKRTAEVFGLKKSVFVDILKLRDPHVKPKRDALIQLFEDYIAEIAKLSKKVDQL